MLGTFSVWQIFYLGQIAACIIFYGIFYLHLKFPVFLTNLYVNIATRKLI